jgi:bifunctional enzyme CysN/CysC
LNLRSGAAAHDEPLPPALESVLEAQAQRSLLRFMTAGSVDDGKSTLIGRLLYDAGLVYEDQLRALEQDSKRTGHAGTGLDLSLLTDGLRAEREQGITIDVAYRYFSTARRQFIIADTPGHEQYTRNMATGASHCDLAIILVDASQGLLTQSCRHTYIAALLGIKHLVLAVNKMDQVGFDEGVFEDIRRAFMAFVTPLGVTDVHAIPVSALHGDNVVHRSTRCPWYQGEALLSYLEQVHVAGDVNLTDLRFPVQSVVRPDASFRGYVGTVASGIVRVGDEVLALPSQRIAQIKRIVTWDGDRDVAQAGQAVTLVLTDDLDLGRGDMLVHQTSQPFVERELEATLIWMDETPLEEGASYWLKHTTNLVPATVREVVHRVDTSSLKTQATDRLLLNEIGLCVLSLARPAFYDAYKTNRQTGSFILIHRQSGATAGAGLVLARKARRPTPPGGVAETWRAQAVTSQIAPERRAQAMGQAPLVLWFTGLPRSGKLVTAYALEQRLFDQGYKACVLDGPVVRQRISTDLTYSADDRGVNVRRVAEMARILADAGLVVICVMVSPYDFDRQAARAIVGEERFVEVYFDAPVEVCEQRDPELYARARRGVIPGFTGISAPYEAPEAPHYVLSIERQPADALAAQLCTHLLAQGRLHRIG